KYHPDANPGDAAAEEKFKEVSAAYDVVGDPERRKEYDQVRAMGPMGSRLSGGGPGGGFGRPGDASFNGADLGDLISNLFGRGEQRGRSGSANFSRGPQRGTDLEADLHLAFMDAVRGVTTSVNLVSDVTCGDCNGTGAARGTSPRVCTDCGGRGVVDDNQGFFSLSHPCASCGGRGNFIDSPCPTCSGTGVTSRPRVVKVRLPEGVKDGQTIRLKGKGGPGRQGGPDGDLYVRVNVEPHPIFNREGDDLHLTVPVSFPEAALGADVRVPTLDGDAVTIRIPPGTPNGRVFRVKARGIATPSGKGDLLVAIDLVVPTSLSGEERSALEALRAASHQSPRAHLGV
ncbi:MAG TPA: DnaJ C-terminal domain-containing protein, partial [Microthrixaceae bacterium]|nr:DnaJ C-terminal domain-containing protein [Microthrixaceae bacterium]